MSAGWLLFLLVLIIVFVRMGGPFIWAAVMIGLLMIVTILAKAGDKTVGVVKGVSHAIAEDVRREATGVEATTPHVPSKAFLTGLVETSSKEVASYVPRKGGAGYDEGRAEGWRLQSPHPGKRISTGLQKFIQGFCEALGVGDGSGSKKEGHGGSH